MFFYFNILTIFLSLAAVSAQAARLRVEDPLQVQSSLSEFWADDSFEDAFSKGDVALREEHCTGTSKAEGRRTRVYVDCPHDTYCEVLEKSGIFTPPRILGSYDDVESSPEAWNPLTKVLRDLSSEVTNWNRKAILRSRGLVVYRLSDGKEEPAMRLEIDVSEEVPVFNDVTFGAGQGIEGLTRQEMIARITLTLGSNKLPAIARELEMLRVDVDGKECVRKLNTYRTLSRGSLNSLIR